MKRILSLIISLAVIVSSFGFTVSASDTDHWAYSVVSELVNEGIISGDQNGNLNLNNNITRAEFIKTVNKYFSLEKKNNISFNDVSEDAWYYEEMMIAGSNGYIKGDQNGNANPDSYITRAEVSVIIARLLDLEDVYGNSFADAYEIPTWAIGAVSALCEKGIIKGYNDGTFKANNLITRAEAFVVVSRNERNKEAAPEEDVTETVTDSPKPVIMSGGSSSGGSSSGGGGGGSSSSSEKKATLSSRYFDKETGLIEFVSENAKSYVIKFSFESGSYEKELSLTKEDGSYKYADISSIIPEIIRESGNNGLDATVYVRAKGKSGYSDSSFVKFGAMTLKMDIPDVTDITTEYDSVNDKYVISWTAVENAAAYKISLYKDSSLETLAGEFETESTTYMLNMADFEIGENLYVIVTARMGDFYGIGKEPVGTVVNGFGGGEGTEANPYLIYNAEQIKNIKTSGYYKQMADITEATPVTSTVTPMDEEFKGTYDGNNKKLYVSISSDVATSDSTKGFGLFPIINGATFKNIILEGSVSGKGNVGGIAGRGTGLCTFENISNYAYVVSSNGYCGGIVGRMYDGNTTGTTIKNCVNYGEVKSFGNAGGIAGVSNGVNVITLCGNLGKVHSTNTNEGQGLAGGIIATAYGNISSSYNFGEVSANKGPAGGIAGNLAKPDYLFENCFNAGKVTGKTFSSAIVSVNAADNKPIIRNSYNLVKDLKVYDGEADVTILNCSTLNKNDVMTGLNIKTPAEMSLEKLSDAFTLSSENSENENYNQSFKYPQIVNNLVPMSLVYDDPNFVMSILAISFDKESGKWYITINPSSKGIISKYVVTVSGAEDTVITEFNDENKYEITNVADGASEVKLAAYNNASELVEETEIMVADFTFSGGIGTEESPYIITNVDQFIKAFGNGSTIESGKSYILTGFDEVAMELPDTFKPSADAFTGKLIGGDIVDGKLVPSIQKIKFDITTGKTTANVDFANVASGSTTYKVQGIIFHVLNGATIKNLAFIGSVNTPNTPSFFGVLAGNAKNSTIENVHNYADISGDQQRGTGGIIGWTGSSMVITNCSNHGNITVPHATTARADVGGIVGNMTSTTITYCYNYGNIQGRDNAGGIAGYSNCDISYCGNYGNISVTRDGTYGYAGGISGRSNGGNITGCFNSGNITSVKYAGGIFAHINSNKTSVVTNCFNLGKIQGTVSAGLAIGINQGNAVVSGFYDIANENLMSLIGTNSGSLTATNAYSYGASETVQSNDVNKTSLDNIQGLTITDSQFADETVWVINGGFGYPDLVKNSYINNKKLTE